ncbi:GRP family sugar transporter [Flavobacterium gawalongense]|uniref:Multidrug DMT transporter permease n=1 Tax=Flavobacterium gawalongense TaxID=2594432 RepID=A0ABY3CFK5_9FLAO|nr:GRP family sugar transporter [Flavobacterium gawalongense]TRW97962.1 multidrug DMT transporter permease [Flavobacterium gawalongense]TRX02344.1 multidrug DMT transporter permease [Flavobacterium gawalongense]
MFIISSYPMAVLFCILSMFCWGSWANTQKATTDNWRFELYNWDYVIGLMLSAFLLAVTLGSFGDGGRNFWVDIQQADYDSTKNALLGGVLFNAANILLVAAIAIVGMSVAFSVGMGFAMVLGVTINYLELPIGNATLLFLGVGLILIAMILNTIAYKKTIRTNTTLVSSKGLMLTLGSGLIMGLFYKYVINSVFPNFDQPLVGKLSPYTAVFIFSIGVFISNCLFNTLLMIKPIEGAPISYSSYFKGKSKNHLMGLLGGTIWCVGMLFSVLASSKAGAAISYGLSSGATIVAAIWGICIWKEFKAAPKEVSRILALMIICFIVGLVLIVMAK